MFRLRMVLFLVSILMISGLAFAEPTHPNEVGLYTTTDGSGVAGTSVVGEPVDLHLVLTRPRDVLNGGIPCQTYGGFQLRLDFDPAPAGDLSLLGIVQIENALDIGIKDFEAGYLEFVSALPAPIPVVDDAVVLATLTIMNPGSQVYDVYMGPGTGGYPIPTDMEFLGGQEGDQFIQQNMYPISGGHDLPVFQFNGAAVATEETSFGSLKALFR